MLLGYGFCQAMFIAPTEATMGDVQRIFYYHLPSAWVAFLLFFVNFLASVWYLIRRNAGADALALAAAEVGVSFCTIVLLTGPIWARPVWGIWWTWDARLTSTLVLWLIYVSYLVLRHYATGGQVPVLAAALGIFGFVDVPIVYMAIRWFRTQHPQPVIGGGEGSGLAPRYVARGALEPCGLRDAGSDVRLDTLPAGAGRTGAGRGARQASLETEGAMNGSHNNAYLYAAYIVVWVVHITYAFTPDKPWQAHEARSRELNAPVATFLPQRVVNMSVGFWTLLSQVEDVASNQVKSYMRTVQGLERRKRKEK